MRLWNVAAARINACIPLCYKSWEYEVVHPRWVLVWWLTVVSVAKMKGVATCWFSEQFQQTNTPNIISLDLDMPSVSDYEIYERLRRGCRAIWEKSYGQVFHRQYREPCSFNDGSSTDTCRRPVQKKCGGPRGADWEALSWQSLRYFALPSNRYSLRTSRTSFIPSRSLNVGTLKLCGRSARYHAVWKMKEVSGTPTRICAGVAGPTPWRTLCSITSLR